MSFIAVTENDAKTILLDDDEMDRALEYLEGGMEVYTLNRNQGGVLVLIPVSIKAGQKTEVTYEETALEAGGTTIGSITRRKL
jgi:hypothetical protein